MRVILSWDNILQYKTKSLASIVNEHCNLLYLRYNLMCYKLQDQILDTHTWNIIVLYCSSLNKTPQMCVINEYCNILYILSIYRVRFDEPLILISHIRQAYEKYYGHYSSIKIPLTGRHYQWVLQHSIYYLKNTVWCAINSKLTYQTRIREILSFDIILWMNDWCFRPRFCTVKAILCRRQPGQMTCIIAW